MKKKIILGMLILILFFSIAIVYLNNVILPTKIKSLLIKTLQEATGKKVALESLQFNIFKGLVVKNLVVYDEQKTIAKLKEGSCSFFIIPFFKKSIIIPSIKLRSAEILLERRKDNTFNVQNLFQKKEKGLKKQKFNLTIYRISVLNSTIHFEDKFLPSPFIKDIKDLSLNLYLSLPASIRFNLKCEIPAKPLIKINGAGQYSFLNQNLTAKLAIQDFSAKEFIAYYDNLGISISEGLIDALIAVESKDGVLYFDASVQAAKLSISKDKISAQLDSNIKADVKYNLKEKKIDFSGLLKVSNSTLKGLEFVDSVDNINAEFLLNNSGIHSKKMNAYVFGFPVEVSLNLNDFNNPLININVASSLSLASLQSLLKEKFKFVMPGEIQGNSLLSLDIQTNTASNSQLKISGYLNILNAILKLPNIKSPIEGIYGKLEFSQDEIRWSAFNFEYNGINFTAKGRLSNFKLPAVQLELDSSLINLQSNFTIDNKILKLANLEGKYLNSVFAVTGNIDTQDTSNLEADLNGKLNLNLEDAKQMLGNQKNQLEQLKPIGIIDAQFSLMGNLNNFKSCVIEAKLSSPLVSIVGLKFQDFLLNYNQNAGIIDIPNMHLSMYDGSADLSGRMNLNSENFPFWVSLDIEGVKIEKLKLDTKNKEKDISGTIQSQAKINGFYKDISKLSGAGRINISDGKLWQLNLFKGLGSLLFAQDFENIVFHEGYCGFIIQDKNIATDNLTLKSNITNLSGPVRIGFDGSVDAAFDVQVLDENVPLKGTFKDITTAIIGQGGRFGVIKITGTLKEPKYKFKPAVGDIIKGIKDIFFPNQ